MRLSILAAAAISISAMVPAFAQDSMTTTTTTIENDNLPVMTSPAPIVVTPAPAIVPAPTIVTPPASETVVVRKKDRHLLRVGIPGVFRVSVF